MSQLYRNDRTGDVITVPVELEQKYDALGHWSRVVTEEEAVELKGSALDLALEDAGLPKSGSADQKRARLAEHAAEQQVPDAGAAGQGDDTKENKA